MLITSVRLKHALLRAAGVSTDWGYVCVVGGGGGGGVGLEKKFVKRCKPSLIILGTQRHPEPKSTMKQSVVLECLDPTIFMTSSEQFLKKYCLETNENFVSIKHPFNIILIS